MSVQYLFIWDFHNNIITAPYKDPMTNVLQKTICNEFKSHKKAE